MLPSRLIAIPCVARRCSLNTLPAQCKRIRLLVCICEPHSPTLGALAVLTPPNNCLKGSGARSRNGGAKRRNIGPGYILEIEKEQGLRQQPALQPSSVIPTQRRRTCGWRGPIISLPERWGGQRGGPPHQVRQYLQAPEGRVSEVSTGATRLECRATESRLIRRCWEALTAATGDGGTSPASPALGPPCDTMGVFRPHREC